MRKAGLLTAVGLFVLTVFLGGCGITAERGPRIHGLTPEQLGALGARIHHNPQRADTYLEEEGITRDQFEAAVQRVSTESDLARRYRKAFDRTLEDLTS